MYMACTIRNLRRCQQCLFSDSTQVLFHENQRVCTKCKPRFMPASMEAICVGLNNSLIWSLYSTGWCKPPPLPETKKKENKRKQTKNNITKQKKKTSRVSLLLSLAILAHQLVYMYPLWLTCLVIYSKF